MPGSTPPLRSCLGFAAVAALVVGDMLGSGVFFTPGELAAVAERPWQVFFVWALAGFVTLCGALTLGELCTLLPRAGASYHFLREGFGPFWGFLLVWTSLCVSGPGSVAGIAAAIGDLVGTIFGRVRPVPPVLWGSAAIVFFVLVNLAGVAWGGRTQVILTVAKLTGIAALIIGGLWLAAPAGVATVVSAAAAVPGPAPGATEGVAGLIRFTGLGIAVVLFTYDGWIDVSHVAGEVRDPARDLPRGLGLGVAALTLLYLLVNLAYLRVVPLEGMREAPTAVAAKVAEAGWGARGGQVLNGLVALSMFGALGGLVMTLPRLYFAMASTVGEGAGRTPPGVFRALGRVSSRSGVPAGAVLFVGGASIVALLCFGTFSKLANFLVVPAQLGNILTVGAVFRLRRRLGVSGYRTPGYPYTPWVYVVTMLGFLASAVVYRPAETLVGVVLSATGVPVYYWLTRRTQ